MVNEYSDAWFGLFLASPNEEQTAREVMFLQRHLPKECFRLVLDVCCGYGRHANPLANAGYGVLGIDRSAPAVDEARNRSGTNGASFLEWPMEHVADLEFKPDAVICM